MKDSTLPGDSSPAKPPAKKKRNLPGTPDPDAEVIALSPKTLLATNRFVCEICNKGFQRDQNLQLHRRGHNLPWKLRQRSGKDVKKRVYVCPEIGCVHHDPSRALGDLTGIKKHFCRKHGEKKWKCEKCSKKYAVQSDWKAHSKICGTREYRCDCGTLFSRRDSFITHRAFCDALAEENAKAQTNAAPLSPKGDNDPLPVVSPPPSPPQPPPPVTAPALPPPQAAEAPAPLSTSLMPPVVSVQSKELLDCTGTDPVNGEILEENSFPARSSCPSNSVFASLFVSSASSSVTLQSEPTTRFNNLLRAISRPIESLQSSSSEAVSLCLSTNQSPLVFASPVGQYNTPSLQPAMSATALLQKAAQMGPTSSKGSLLRGLGLVCSSPSDHDWTSPRLEPSNSPLAAGQGLAISNDEASGFKEVMMGSQTVFGPKQTTLDFLGLGISTNGGSAGGLPALMTSINRGQIPRYGSNGGQYGGEDIGGR